MRVAERRLGGGRALRLVPPFVAKAAVLHDSCGTMVDELRIEEWHSASHGVPEGLDMLVDAARRADGHKPLGEHALAELKAGPQEMPHAAFVARLGPTLVGYAHVSYRKTSSGWRFEFVTHPSHRGRGIARMLVAHVVEHVADDGGGTLHTWAPDDADRARLRLISRFGFSPIRRLHQQHRPLPLEHGIALPDGIRVRGFREEDGPAWLALHNVVFARHPDASGWRAPDLAWRLAEPWFEPEGFRLALDDAGIAAYNWVKMHDHEDAAHDPSDTTTKLVAEIYMLGVAERTRGTGLAAAIAADGLAWGAERGATRAMLYVDEDNEPAFRLYERLGFRTTHVDICYSLEVGAAPGSRGPHP